VPTPQANALAQNALRLESLRNSSPTNLGGNTVSTASPIQIESSVTEFLKPPRKMLVGGRWVEAASGKTFDTYNPATGGVLARVAGRDRRDVDRAVAAARKAFESGPWPDMLPAERAQLLWKLADLIDQHHEELAELETLDNGKPIFFSRIVNVPTCARTFRYMAGGRIAIPEFDQDALAIDEHCLSQSSPERTFPLDRP